MADGAQPDGSSLWELLDGLVRALLERGRTQPEHRDAAARVRRAARQLGFRMGAGSAFGEIDGVPVSIAARGYLGAQNFAFVRCSAGLAAPLGLGLRVLDRSTSSELGSPEQRVAVSRGVDSTLRVLARERELARRLLRGPVGHQLELAARARFEVAVDDASVTLDVDGVGAVASRIMSGAKRAARIAWLLTEERAKLPRHDLSEQMRESWREAARGLGGRFDRHAEVLSVGGAEVRVECRPELFDSHRWQTRVEARLVEPLGCTLKLIDKAEVSRWKLWWNPDIETGDEQFDDTFVVRGEPDDEVQAVLDERARQRLLALFEQCDELRVDHEGVVGTVDGRLLDGRRLVELVRASLEAGRALARRPVRRAGPYR